jgi:hypothetical protein
MRRAFNRNVKQLVSGLNVRSLFGRRRRRKAKDGIDGLGMMSDGTAGMAWRWAYPAGVVRSLLELLLCNNALRLECWIR